VLSDYWSQTYRPGHHNFDEFFVFEPALAPGADAAQISELEAAGIVSDFRPPDVVRIAPVPLYNTFEDVWHFADVLQQTVSG
jgi:kynureninase